MNSPLGLATSFSSPSPSLSPSHGKSSAASSWFYAETVARLSALATKGILMCYIKKRQASRALSSLRLHINNAEKRKKKSVEQHKAQQNPRSTRKKNKIEEENLNTSATRRAEKGRSSINNDTGRDDDEEGISSEFQCHKLYSARLYHLSDWQTSFSPSGERFSVSSSDSDASK